MKLFFPILFFSVNLSFAGEVYLMRLNEGQKDVLIQKLQDIDVNEICFKSSEKCLKRISEKPKVEVKSTLTAGNPASLYCQSIGGKNLILEDKKRNEYDFCEFTEGYVVNSWHIYKKYKK